MSFVALALGLGLLGSSAQDACDNALRSHDDVYSEVFSENDALIDRVNAASRDAERLRPVFEACLNDAGVAFPACEGADLSSRIYGIRSELHSVRRRVDVLTSEVREERRDFDNACRGQMATAADHAHNLSMLDGLIETHDSIRDLEARLQEELDAYARQAGRIFGGRRMLNGGIGLDDQTELYVGVALPDDVDPNSEMIRRGEAWRDGNLSDVRLQPGQYDSSIYIGVVYPDNALRVTERAGRSWSFQGGTRSLAPRLDFSLRFTRRDMMSVENFEISEPLLDLEFAPELTGTVEAPIPALQVRCRDGSGCIRSVQSSQTLSEVLLPAANAAALYEQLVTLQFAAYHSTFSLCNSGEHSQRADACFQEARVFQVGFEPRLDAWPARALRLYGLSCGMGQTDACDPFEVMTAASEGEVLEHANALAELFCEDGVVRMCEMIGREAPSAAPVSPQAPEPDVIAGAEHLELDGQFAVNSCSEFRCSFKASTRTGGNRFYEEFVLFRARSHLIRITEFDCDAREARTRRWEFVTETGSEGEFEEATWTFNGAYVDDYCVEETGTYTIADGRTLAEEQRPD